MQKKTNLLQDTLYDDLTIFSRAFPENRHIQLVQGRRYNIKITTDLDYFISERVSDFVKNIE